MTLETSSSSAPKRKTRKEYDLFREAKKAELGDNYPDERGAGTHWTTEQFKEFYQRGYSKEELPWENKLPRLSMITDAYMALSFPASKLLMVCINQTYYPKQPKKREQKRKKQHELKPNPFRLTYNAARVFGFTNKRTTKKAFDELKALGFLEQVGDSNYGEANIYKLSYRHLKLTSEQVIEIKKQLKG